MRLRALTSILCAIACAGAAPRVSNLPPTANTDIRLADGATLHVRDLPLGRLDGIVMDGAHFDSTGTRIAFIARFPSGAVNGDWRHAAPALAYVADRVRRTLEALTSDGLASGIRWDGSSRVIVTDAGAKRTFDVGPPARETSAGHARVEAIDPSTTGVLESPASEFRLQVIKDSSGAYAVGQVGAVRLRTVAVAPGGGAALVGSLVVWVDSTKNGGPPFARSGPDDVAPLAFSDSSYGSELTPIVPLGHLAFQGAYRNGTAYFAFSLGLSRIVASTNDLFTYAYPALPQQPDFTIGDGLGAGADGILYFADPVNRVMQTWRGSAYAERQMTFPDEVSDTRRLQSSMTQLSGGDRLWPPMRPDADALDAALLEWRIYPVGDTTGPRWVASYLGRAYIGGSDLRFREISEPAFPFATLGRTDDGRLWGASPVARTTQGAAIIHSVSRIWSSRDGVHWSSAGDAVGDAGAVGLHDGVPWVAMTAFEPDAPGVEVARLDGGPAHAAATGAIYAGEDFFFADLSTGFYLVCGGEPGTRSDDGSGALVALRLNPAQLFAFDDRGRNVYLNERLASGDSGQSNDEISAIVNPSLVGLRALNSPYVSTIVADQTSTTSDCCRAMTPESVRKFELEYAWRPFPLARINVTATGDDSANVIRTLERGPLSIDGQDERWHRDSSGTWHLSSIVRHWTI